MLLILTFIVLYLVPVASIIHCAREMYKNQDCARQFGVRRNEDMFALLLFGVMPVVNIILSLHMLALLPTGRPAKYFKNASWNKED